jgi:hypothetical protein
MANLLFLKQKFQEGLQTACAARSPFKFNHQQTELSSLDLVFTPKSFVFMRLKVYITL